MMRVELVASVVVALCVTACSDDLRQSPQAEFTPFQSPVEDTSTADLAHIMGDVTTRWEEDVPVSPDDAGPEIEAPPLQWGEVPPPTGIIDGIRYIRLITTEGPAWVSWFEIEVNGTWSQMGGEVFNLAMGRPVEAPGSSPDNGAPLLVDGDHGTPWNAGVYPPTTLTLDLLLEAEISEIRLRVAQTPNGPTRHELQLAGSDKVFTETHVFDGTTVDGQWLVWPSDEPQD